MSNLLKDHIEEVNKEVEKYSELKDDAFELKTDITVFALGGLIKSLKESIDEYCEDGKEKKYYDETFGEKLTNKISELITAFSKIKAPTVTVTPNISVDFKPIAESINNSNKTLIGEVQKMTGGNKNDELYREIISMVKEQKNFITKTFKDIDYTEKLNELIQVMKDARPLIQEIKAVKNQNNGSYTMTPTYKK